MGKSTDAKLDDLMSVRLARRLLGETVQEAVVMDPQTGLPRAKTRAEIQEEVQAEVLSEHLELERLRRLEPYRSRGRQRAQARYVELVDDLRQRPQDSLGMSVVAPVNRADEVPAPKPVQRRVAQEQAILAELHKLGHDPMALPRPVPGKASTPVQEVRTNLRYTPDVMQKAVSRLRDDGRIAFV
ncbi:MAG: hypothetical protein ABS84_15565 [Rubrivivax sp. SCN 71-131]|nr:MAG: hypothetical protein ABS84_15565 [Rubrivivax sp. SCN 71-131]